MAILSAKEYLKTDDCIGSVYLLVNDITKMTALSSHLYTIKIPEKLLIYYNSVIERAMNGNPVITECAPSKSKRLPTYCTETKRFHGSHIAILNLIAHCYKPTKKKKEASIIW